MPTRRQHAEAKSLPSSERAAKQATFLQLLDSAMRIIQEDGQIPSVAETAARAHISRATAYRYFPSRSALLTAVIDASLEPIRSHASNLPDARDRIHELLRKTFPRFQEFEPQMRAAALLSLEQWAKERAGVLKETPYRRGHRVHILAHALEPLKSKLPVTIYARLHKSLSLVYGIEPYIVLKDIWGATDAEVERTALWMADALLDAALREMKK